MKKYSTQPLLLLGAFIFLGCSGQSDNAQSAEQNETQSPNIILIMSDDQGWGDLSMNGNANLSTPNIDNLAKNGISFEHFYVSPVCSPTRAELLTGRYHTRGGVYSTSAGGERLDLDETTIAQHFQKAGYQTACYGKWHNGMQYPYHPNGRGFDDFYGFASGHWGNYFSPMLERNGAIVKGDGYIIDDLTNKGIEFIQKNKEQPFFLYLPYNTPHSPMQVPDRWWNEMDGKTLDSLHRDPSKEDPQFTRAALAMCENIDWNVGRLIQTLKTQGLEENTIVLYLSDNGPNSWRWNGDMKGRKGATDEGGVRSPLLMQWKGRLEAGKKIEEIAGIIDIFPTLADLAQIVTEQEKTLDGKSLKPIMLNEGQVSWEDRMLINHWNGKTSVRSQQYRLDHEGQLFDINNDPGQRNNIAEAHPEVVEKLAAARHEWEKDALAELPAEDQRSFLVGHPDFRYHQIPARDGAAHGNIQRSNRYPNCSFFENWTSTEDSISWEVEVLEAGDFAVEVYYTCKPEDVGATMRLNFQDIAHTFKINEAHDPPLIGMENDRIERQESYVKDFKSMSAGVMHFSQGKGTLSLKATEIPGSEAIDFRMLMLEKLE
ncbi:arylsulfatase A-like enzyme [Catalinimonas alkaloidigena]|uniref:arylsulfatase n=1 Tax=Catalinimonas alkaloidigena TaxID=1075417 RepID=UPI002405382B|nr:arylsulfatase [Catalinimonas alkaloidigena]MDF9800674.1 arylsulfatase A-like enzyme [Catalinimonas alkaloidigena]